MQIIIQSQLVCTFGSTTTNHAGRNSLCEHGICFIARAISQPTCLMLVCLNISLSDLSKEREIMIDVGFNGFYCSVYVLGMNCDVNIL